MRKNRVRMEEETENIVFTKERENGTI